MIGAGALGLGLGAGTAQAQGTEGYKGKATTQIGGYTLSDFTALNTQFTPNAEDIMAVNTSLTQLTRSHNQLLPALETNINAYQLLTKTVGTYIPIATVATKETAGTTSATEQASEAIEKSGGILQSATSYLMQYANAQIQAKSQGKGLLNQLTGLVGGTLLNEFGPAISDKIGGIFKGKKAADEGSAAESTANAAANMAEGASGLFKESGKLPFPINLVAVALSIAAIIGMIAVVAKARSAAKMAGGGIIPPGYPNDTFPAMLSSGEMVIPKMNVPKFSTERFEGEESGEVRFEIEGDRLVGILKKQGKKLAIY
jgi:hypothetical protein